ncbi:amino acid adenylation domain-containing protein [Actinoplanes sp. NPDC049316]|uniref:amino acid adenylation domain-containing protein n=1 Tax=Actinoplanes sp. NPDC049316 TaxID=3154727 RepID=UPI003449B27F
MRLLHEAPAGQDASRCAVRFRGPRPGELSYGELEARSNRLAHALIDAGIGAGTVVGLLLDRGLHLPVAQLAVMKAGAAWTPLDPQHPSARLALQLRDAAVPLVLASADLAGALPPEMPRWILGEREPSGPETAPDVTVDPRDPAYLLYTSGSTGTPKGVLVPHEAAASFCRTAVDLFALTPADRVAQVSNPAFDTHIFDSFATLLAGATMISAPRGSVTDPAALTALLTGEGVTVSYLPPALLALLDPRDLTGSPLRALMIAGSALGADLVNRWSRPGLALHNSYGPTETTVVVTDYLCPAGPLTAPPPIGAALPHHRAYILDRRLRPVPVGVPGQLFISGTGVAYGYLGRPGLTAERFLADPYSDPGRLMYATGDLTRWRPDGVIEFLGRIDRQVKLRGLRIELGEVEHVIGRHPGVRQCAVTVHEGARLVAYLVGDARPAAVRGSLAERLPAYMIPTAWHVLPELPLTSNGKLDTARLPEPEFGARAYVAPRTETERWLAGTWQDLLGAGRIGAGDTLFGLGANSLHTTQLIARVSERFGVALHPRDLYADPTLAQLAEQLDRTADDALTERIPVVARDGALPCTVQQEGLWFVQRLDPSSPVYHLGFGLRLRGDLDHEALEAALLALVRRHEALRTRFVEVDGGPRQVVDPAPETLRVPVGAIALGEVERWAAGQVSRPMDLAAGPLFRAALARVAPGEHVLVLVVHHIVADGWSVGILAAELSRLYGATGPGPAPLPLQPADHAAWQRARLAGPEGERQLAYWREHLAGLATVDLPADRRRPAEPTGAGAVFARRMPDELVEAARSFARTHHVSFLAVFQAALLTVLHRYTGQTDLPIGSVFSGRTRTELEPLVGFFTNTVVLRTDAGGDPTFAELVRRCHETVLDATVHQDLPFGVIVDALQPERVSGRNPLFQISLTLQPGRGGGGAAGLTLGGLRADEVRFGTRFARFDLGIELAESPDGRIGLSMEYSTELFDADRIERLSEHFLTVLGGGLATPDTPAAGLEVMPAAERYAVLHGWNPPPEPRARELLHEVTAGHSPDAVAIGHGDERLTYAELEQRSNRLAHALTGAGIGTGDVVGLRLGPGPGLLVAQFAVLKAGAAWTPSADAAPGGATPALVLTTTALAPAGVRHWCLDEGELTGPDTAPAVRVDPADPACLLPGGLLTHGAAYARCGRAVARFGLGPADRVEVDGPAAADSALDCFAALLAGATVVVPPRGGTGTDAPAGRVLRGPLVDPEPAPLVDPEPAPLAEPEPAPLAEPEPAPLADPEPAR